MTSASAPESSPAAPPELPGYLVLRTGTGWLPAVVRLLAGGAFVGEGARKFLDAGAWGVGRFEALGIPFPGYVAPLVGGFEVACGLLLLVGLGVRVAAFPLLGILVVAVALTWTTLADAWYELALSAGLVLLLFRGGGRLSLDGKLWRDAAGG
jgi:putative oxidoreductase